MTDTKIRLSIIEVSISILERKIRFNNLVIDQMGHQPLVVHNLRKKNEELKNAIKVMKEYSG